MERAVQRGKSIARQGKIAVDYVLQGLKELLEFSARNLRRALRWMQDNPEQVVVLAIAVAQAYAGDYSALIGIGMGLLAAGWSEGFELA